MVTRVRLAMAAAVTFSAVLTGMSAMAAVFGWVSWAIAHGSLAGAGWVVAGLLVALTRPGWSRAEKAALHGETDLPGLLEATPKAGERQ